MKKTIVRLDIEKSKYVTLEFFGKVKDLYLLDEITIAYHEQRRKYILYTKDFIAGSFRDFENGLKMALNGQLIVHDSIKHDLGYLWSEYLEDKKGYNFVKEPSENTTFWVGLRYLFLESVRQWTTWLYNKDGDIYMEITPCYKWHFDEPKKNKNYIPYDEFIKNYKPLAIIKLDKKVAKQWLKVVSKLVKIAQANYEIARQQDDLLKKE